MTSKSWDDSDIADISAGLDDELKEIFADMEAVFGKSKTAGAKAADPADDFDDPLPEGQDDPWAEERAEEDILPDEFSLPPAPGRRRPLAGDFERSAAGIAPADLLDEEDELYDRPARPLRRPPAEDELPEAEILPDETDDHRSGRRERPLSGPYGYAATVAELSPDDLSRLIERAVIRGLALAVKKTRR